MRKKKNKTRAKAHSLETFKEHINKVAKTMEPSGDWSRGKRKRDVLGQPKAHTSLDFCAKGWEEFQS